jgi:hypothetical protein
LLLPLGPVAGLDKSRPERRAAPGSIHLAVAAGAPKQDFLGQDSSTIFVRIQLRGAPEANFLRARSSSFASVQTS